MEMTPEQATFLRDFLLTGIQEEFGATRRVLAAVPDDNEKNSYRPDPKSRSARELARHIVDSELQFSKGIADGAFTMTAESPNHTSNMAELIEHYETGFKTGIDRIRSLSGEQLAAPIDFFGVFNFPAVVYLTFLANHTIHHRGQLSSYLRAMDSKVPAIYGPSGDEMWSSEATAG